MKVWIVLPAYNEEKGLPTLLDSLIEVFQAEHKVFAIVVVNDGSKDGTGAVIESYAARSAVIAVHNSENMGLAETLKKGLLEAVRRADPKDIIITMDADNTHPAGLALRMARRIREGTDVVIASRYRDGSRVVGLASSRKWLSVIASMLFRIFFPIAGVRDYTCGYRAYRVSAMKDLMDRYQDGFISEKGFSCMVDILLRLREFDLVFGEVPLILRYDRKVDASKMKVLQTAIDTLKLMFRRKLFD